MNPIRFVWLVCAAAVIGCGGTKEVPRGIVQGRVTLDGKPLNGATILFESQAIGVSQTAALDDEGQYTFSTYNATGLPAGSYKVCLFMGRFLAPGEEFRKIDPNVKVPPPPKKSAVPLPDKYTTIEKSGLTANVQVGNNPPFNFDLKP